MKLHPSEECADVCGSSAVAAVSARKLRDVKYVSVLQDQLGDTDHCYWTIDARLAGISPGGLAQSGGSVPAICPGAVPLIRSAAMQSGGIDLLPPRPSRMARAK